MRIIPGNAQHIGSRKEQQDDFGFSDTTDIAFISHGGVLALVTDGMGGLSQGREASLLAKRTMLQQYAEKSVDETVPQALKKALEAANSSVVEMARQGDLEGETGTTLAAAVIKDEELYWISVGDSHIYLYRRGEMCQLSTDHDYARQLSLEVAKGSISPEEAANHPQRRALTSYLGHPNLEDIDRNEDPIILQPGDRILLCSDGLYKTLHEEEIVRLIEQHPQHAAEELIGLTLARGKTNQDNVTVAMLACESEMEPDLFSPPQAQPKLQPPEPPTLQLPPPTFHTINRKFIVISILIVCMIGAAYLAKYLPSRRNHVKDNITALETPKIPLDIQGPPLVESEKQAQASKTAEPENKSIDENPAKKPIAKKRTAMPKKKAKPQVKPL